MFVGITNTPRDYAWGSTRAIADLLGRAPSGGPEAELWLGAHAGSPSIIEDPSQFGGATNLAQWITASPEVALGAGWSTRQADADAASDGAAGAAGSVRPVGVAPGSPLPTPRLPFLLKILAAGRPLSLQAHPTSEQARAGFDLENEAGIPVDAGNRNYRDPFHKPELIFVLSDTFEALCGFRPLAEVRGIVAELRLLDLATDDPQGPAIDSLENHLAQGLRDTVDWLLRDGRGGDSGEVKWLVERVVALAEHAEFLAGGGAAIGYARELATVRLLAAEYPGDPGIVLGLLLNRVSLQRGEAMYLPAGNIHAYLSGLGVELMAASDNVLRGGLTPKHIDIEELLGVLDFTPAQSPYLAPVVTAPGVSRYRPGVPDFELVHIEADADSASATPVPMRQITLTGPAIAICTAGGLLVAGSSSSRTLKRGQAVYVTPDEGTLTFAGTGEVFLAMPAA